MFVKNQGGLGRGNGEVNRPPNHAPEPGVGPTTPMEDKPEHVFAGDWGPGGEAILSGTPKTIQPKPTNRGGHDAGFGN